VRTVLFVGSVVMHINIQYGVDLPRMGAETATETFDRNRIEVMNHDFWNIFMPNPCGLSSIFRTKWQPKNCLLGNHPNYRKGQTSQK
jgi:hypothetical protein